jgi:hypothetical protein
MNIKLPHAMVSPKFSGPLSVFLEAAKTTRPLEDKRPYSSPELQRLS